MITIEQILQAKHDYLEKRLKTPTRIVMNPVGAYKLYQYIRSKALSEIKTWEIWQEVYSRMPLNPSTLEGEKVCGLVICYARHYKEDYFEVCD